MKKLLILSLLLPFNLFSQKSYKSPNAYQKVISHKSFAILPFDFKITGRVKCRNILKKLGRGKIIAQVQPVVRTNAYF